MMKRIPHVVCDGADWPPWPGVVYRLGQAAQPEWLRGRRVLLEDLDPDGPDGDAFGSLSVKVLVRGHRVETECVTTWDGRVVT